MSNVDCPRTVALTRTKISSFNLISSTKGFLSHLTGQNGSHFCCKVSLDDKKLATMATSPIYNFYLNVIILNNSNNHATSPSTPMKEPVKRDESPSHQFQNEESDTALVTPLSQNTKAIQAIFSGHNLISSKSNNAFQKMSERANAYIASKTMLTRASAAMPEVLPKLADEFESSISIQRRFTQGPVFVLEVSILPKKVTSLLRCLKGKDDAEQYERAVESLKALGCLTTLKALESDIMSQIIKFVKAKLLSLLPMKLNEECKGGELEMDCIALEDDEQAKWLFNFLEFNAEMMKEAKI